MAVDAECRALGADEVDAAARVMARAFLEDPLCAFMLPRRAGRERTLEKFFRVTGLPASRAGRLYGTGTPLEGVAFWQFPGGPSASIPVSALPRLLPLLFTAYPAGLLRARPILAAQEELRARHAPGPHFYLDNLGVDPEARGRGASSKLLHPVLARADARGLPVCTDTVTAANLPIYARFGFACVESRAIAATGVTLHALLRPAQPAPEISRASTS